MCERGMQFLQVPKSYYKDLRERLQHSTVKITEDLDIVRSCQYLYCFR
jgi:4-hydroxyphenylpyruvate dioxygenase